MSRLTAAERKALPDSAFAGPNRTYPVNDPGHAKAAKSMAGRYAPPAEKKKIDAKANKVLGKSDGPGKASDMFRSPMAPAKPGDIFKS